MAHSVRFLAASVWFLVRTHGLHLRGPENTTGPTNASEDVEFAFMDEHKPKLFFIAGIEGSGARVFQELWKRSFEYDDDHTQHVLKFTPSWVCGHNWPFTDYNVMRDRMKTVKVNDIQALPFQATYPSCGVKSHDHADRMEWFHPDLEWLIHAARDAEADLHIIFMYRNVVDALKYGCKNQRYEVTCALQAESLISNADILLFQLGEIKKYNASKLSCFNYASDAEVQKGVQAVFHDPLPNIEHEFVRRNISDFGPFTDAELLGQMDMLQQKTTQMGEMCDSLSQFTLDDYLRFIKIGHGNTGRLHIQTPPR